MLNICTLCVMCACVGIWDGDRLDRVCRGANCKAIGCKLCRSVAVMKDGGRSGEK